MVKGLIFINTKEYERISRGLANGDHREVDIEVGVGRGWEQEQGGGQTSSIPWM